MSSATPRLMVQIQPQRPLSSVGPKSGCCGRIGQRFKCRQEPNLPKLHKQMVLGWRELGVGWAFVLHFPSSLRSSHTSFFLSSSLPHALSLAYGAPARAEILCDTMLPTRLHGRVVTHTYAYSTMEAGGQPRTFLPLLHNRPQAGRTAQVVWAWGGGSCRRGVGPRYATQTDGKSRVRLCPASSRG
jgi:hypothetical protein